MGVELPGNHVLTLADTAYPRALLTMPDPPPLLYVKGRLELLQTRAVAIVGSRSATPQGIEDARRFARALSDAGLDGRVGARARHRRRRASAARWKAPRARSP